MLSLRFDMAKLQKNPETANRQLYAAHFPETKRHPRPSPGKDVVHLN